MVRLIPFYLLCSLFYFRVFLLRLVHFSFQEVTCNHQNSRKNRKCFLRNAFFGDSLILQIFGTFLNSNACVTPLLQRVRELSVSQRSRTLFSYVVYCNYVHMYCLTKPLTLPSVLLCLLILGIEPITRVRTIFLSQELL